MICYKDKTFCNQGFMHAPVAIADLSQHCDEHISCDDVEIVSACVSCDKEISGEDVFEKSDEPFCDSCATMPDYFNL